MMTKVIIEEKAISFLKSFLDELEFEELTYFFNKFRKKGFKDQSSKIYSTLTITFKIGSDVQINGTISPR